MFGLDLTLIFGGIAAALAFALRVIWGQKKAAEQRADQADRAIKVHKQVRSEDREIDERMRQAEGASDEERDNRISNPNKF